PHWSAALTCPARRTPPPAGWSWFRVLPRPAVGPRVEPPRRGRATASFPLGIDPTPDNTAVVSRSSVDRSRPEGSAYYVTGRSRGHIVDIAPKSIIAETVNNPGLAPGVLARAADRWWDLPARRPAVHEVEISYKTGGNGLFFDCPPRRASLN